ncbi:histidine kinase [Paenibacillus zeisoli]|uniref:Histidine kinase n=1 Tax=Paenibacillus zeisoli TaxID=2496267 RepID=A0A3S1D4C7_9BACL|nr:histidine kinase [Paenibacillus zeisoli]RUT29181.1 histidine kinase [Paenibacillus zeisoli]
MKLIKDYWTSQATESLVPITDLIWTENESEFRLLQPKLSAVEEQEAFRKVQDELIRGVIQIDGGDALADKLRLDLIDIFTKDSLKENVALHEEFVSYLIDVE